MSSGGVITKRKATLISSVAYRPEIDGLRAVAIIPVVLFHMSYSWIPGGFLGIDVFFVISGFLITSVILADHARGRFGYLDFWLRRVRRIFPALVVMLVITSIAGHFALAAHDRHDLGTTGLATLLAYANFTFWRLPGGYWGTQAENQPLLNTWTLSAEEQFYFLFPCYLGLMLRFGRKWVFAGTLAAALASFALYLYGVRHHPAAAFYLLPMRGWELASGCLLSIAWWKFSWQPKGNTLLALAGLAAIACCYLLQPAREFFGVSPAVVVAGSVLVIAFGGGHQSIANRLLSARPMVFVGKISYSLYLWHLPVIVLCRNHYLNGGEKIPDWVPAFLMTLVSVASYYLVEQTTRRSAKIIRPALMALAVSLALSVSLLLQDSSVDMSAYSPVVWRGREYDANPAQAGWDGARPGRTAGIQATDPVPVDKNAYKTNGVIKRYGTGGVDIVVLGDSHALMWAGVLDEIAQDRKLTISFFTADATNPFSVSTSEDTDSPIWNREEKHLFDTTRLERIREWKPRLVLLLTRWSAYNGEETGELLTFLGQNAAHVLTIEQPPELFFGDRNTPRQLIAMKIVPRDGLNQYVRLGNREHYERGGRLLTELESRYSFFHRIKVADLYRRENSTAWVFEGRHVLYIDDDHLSQYGALKAKERIDSAIGCFVAHCARAD